MVCYQGCYLSVVEVRQSTCNIDSQGHTMAWLVTISAVPALQQTKIKVLFPDNHTSILLDVIAMILVVLLQ
jgi:hypothetical protein